MKTTVDTSKVWHNICWGMVAISISVSFLMAPGSYRKTIIDEVHMSLAGFKADEEQERIQFRKAIAPNYELRIKSIEEKLNNIMPSAFKGQLTGGKNGN